MLYHERPPPPLKPYYEIASGDESNRTSLCANLSSKDQHIDLISFLTGRICSTGACSLPGRVKPKAAFAAPRRVCRGGQPIVFTESDIR
jgi:hypothetical protein